MNENRYKRVFVPLIVALLIIAAIITVIFVILTASDHNTLVTDLKTEGMDDPIGIDDRAPSFSWKLKSERDGIYQTSYRIRVRDENGKSMWDTSEIKEGRSNEIIYEGKTLHPQTVYIWNVEVKDQNGHIFHSEDAKFETALMDTETDAWNGAKWIGPDTLSFDAVNMDLFHIRTDVQMDPQKGKASLIFGANDFRFTQANFNPYGYVGENYFRLELDVSDAVKNGQGPALRVYRVGYHADCSPESPILEVSSQTVPATNLKDLFTETNRFDMHMLDLEVSQNTMKVSVDGTEVILGYNNGAVFTFDLMDDGMMCSYLNSVGFWAGPGEKAVYKNYEILNPGYGTGILFDSDTQTDTGIFDGLDGIQVSGNRIIVNGGEKGILSYADPSSGSSPMLRKEFAADNDVCSARLYISAQGIYEFRINGRKCSDGWFLPGNAEYREKMPYQTFDITEYIQNGKNAIGVQLGRGWWNGSLTPIEENYNYYGDRNALLAMIEIRYKDGSIDRIVSDSTWEYYDRSPLISDSFYHGVRYDETREKDIEGFFMPGYESSELKQASVIEPREEFSNYEMTARCTQPVHVTNELNVSRSLGETLRGSGSFLYDMGENVAGVPSITVPEGYAEKGDLIIIRYGEMLYPDSSEYVEKGLAGQLMTENYRTALSTDFYVVSGETTRIEPHFTLHGYRYIEITGLKKELPAENIKTLVLSSVDTTSEYESSNKDVNRLFKNILNSQKSNFISLPTDCPQRDERLGWLGDAQIFSKAASYNADVYNFYRDWLASVRAEQSENGNLPSYAPSYEPVVNHQTERDSIDKWNSIVWKCAIAVIPYNLYIQTGRTRIIQENLDAACRYIDYLDQSDFLYSNKEQNVIPEPALTGRTGVLGDWLGRCHTDEILINQAYYVYMLGITSEMAEIVGDMDTSLRLEQMYNNARDAWNRLFIDPQTGVTCDPAGNPQETQASYAIPLAYHIIEEKTAEKAAENLNRLIKNPQGKDDKGVEILPYTLTTGFAGTACILPALTEYGYWNTAENMLKENEYASWIYPITQGATSIWERFDSYTEERGFGGNNSMNSFNHFSFGAVSDWMIQYQAGISPDKTSPGYRKIILQPSAGGNFEYVNASVETPYGKVSSGWTFSEGKIKTYSALIPDNTSAVLYLPCTEFSRAEFPEEISFEGTQVHNGCNTAVFRLPSGTWKFCIGKNVITAERGS